MKDESIEKGPSKPEPKKKVAEKKEESSNTYISPVQGYRLSDAEINQMRRLHEVTWEWRPGKWTAFPSGSYDFHLELVPENVRRHVRHATYAEAGYDLNKLQEMLLVDFRDYRTNVSQETLNAGLMLPCAVALHKLSREIGTLDNIDSRYPSITLIEAIERDYTAENPRNCFRSSFQQLQAYKNTTGSEYDPDEHYKHSGYIARPGKSPHGTGNAFDVPSYLADNKSFIKHARKHGFVQRLPESDPRHLEYYGKDFVDFPRPDDVARYATVYTRLEEARL